MKMGKYLRLMLRMSVLAVIFLIGIMGTAGVVQAATLTDSGTGLGYEVLQDGTVEITGYTGKSVNLTIPKTLDGKKVTSIGEEAFRGSTDLDNGENRKVDMCLNDSYNLT